MARIRDVAHLSAALAALTLGCQVGHKSAEEPASTASVPPAPVPPAAVALPAPVDRAAVLAAAPELTEESASVVIASAPEAAIEVAARASLLEATRGFSYLTTAELHELGAIFERAYRPLTEDERRRLESYLGGLRAGELPASGEEAAARAIFNAAVSALPPADRRRLQALYARAIDESLSARRRAALPPQQLARGRSGTSGLPAGALFVPSPPTTMAPAPVERSEAAIAQEERLRKELAQHRRALSAAKSNLAGAESALRDLRERREYVSRRVASSQQLDVMRELIGGAEKQVELARRAEDDAASEVRRCEALLALSR